MDLNKLLKKIQDNPVIRINGEVITSSIEQRQTIYNGQEYTIEWWVRKDSQNKIISETYLKRTSK